MFCPVDILKMHQGCKWPVPVVTAGGLMEFWNCKQYLYVVLLLGHVPQWEMQLFLFRVSVQQCDPFPLSCFLSVSLFYDWGCEGKNVRVLVHLFFWARESVYVCVFVFLLNWVTDFYEITYERYAAFIQWHDTRIKNRIPKIMLKYRPDGWRWPRKPLKRPLDETKTGLTHDGWWWWWWW